MLCYVGFNNEGGFMKTFYFSKFDGIFFIIIIACVMGLLWVYTLNQQIKVKGECGLSIPKMAGKFCQQRDLDGNIFYVSEDKKIVVSIK